MEAKLEHLKRILHDMDGAAVAYSGGVDSTLLFKVAFDCLGDKAVALTAISRSLPEQERIEAREIIRRIGGRWISIETQETEDPRYLANNPKRCYFCKDKVYERLINYAHNNGYDNILDGTNADDIGDHRPGRQAARERGVRSPLHEVGLKKSEIRELAKIFELPNWNKPAAACLSSRVPYGTTITMEMLSNIEQAEMIVKKSGVRQVRVRHHGHIARIEIEPSDFQIFLTHAKQIDADLKGLGYAYVTLDLAGFRSGSLNEVLLTADGRPKTKTTSD